MTPSFRIIADRVDVTAAIKDRLLELAVIDVAGVESDEVKLTLDDRRREDGALAELPRIGTRLEVALGYAETALIGMGSYVVDEIEISSPPATLSVSAKAADMSGPMRSPKTRSWENLTLGDVVATIAREHRLLPATDPELASIPIVHIDQTAESDMAFLTRLASHYDAVAKPANGHWVFTKRGQAKSATGKSLPTVGLKAQDLIEWRYRHSARRPGGSGKSYAEANAPPVAASGVKAYYWDFDTGERKAVTVGKPPYSEVRHVHVSKEKALAAARSALSVGERGQGALSLTLPGDPRLVAEARIEIDLRPGIPTAWIVDRAEHHVHAQGYTTQLECIRAS